VHISTDEVYGDIEKGQFYETTPFNPSSPYSASKAAADMLVGSYVRTFGFPAVIVRPSNNYGIWQYPEKFIPVVIFKALKNEKIPVYGKGLNVKRVAACVGLLPRCHSSFGVRQGGEIYNIGSGNERRNIDVVKAILDILGKPQNLIEFVKDRPGTIFVTALTRQKLKRI